MALEGELICSNTHEATIKITIIAPSGKTLEVRAVLDTGFTDYLTLPRSIIDQLNLPFVDTSECQLADGRIVRMQSYLVLVDWHGERREVIALSADGEPLLGMSLLSGSRITMDVIAGGEFRIEKI